MNNIRKVVKQIEINVAIFVISVAIIYIGQAMQYRTINISWTVGLNAELVFVMISSLCSVVGWRIVEEIKKCFEYNLFLFLTLIIFGVEYGIALVMGNSETVKMFILFSGIPFFTFYILEQIWLLMYASKNESKQKANSLRYGER